MLRGINWVYRFNSNISYPVRSHRHTATGADDDATLLWQTKSIGKYLFWVAKIPSSNPWSCGGGRVSSRRLSMQRIYSLFAIPATDDDHPPNM